MSNLNKRILALILTAAMLMSFVPFTLTSNAANATGNGIAGYWMDVVEQETYLRYEDGNVNEGSSNLFMMDNMDPLSQNATYTSAGSSGVYVRKWGNEYFTILNPAEKEINGKIEEAQGSLFTNTISGRGTGINGVPSDLASAWDSLTHLAIRLRVTGGAADQYSSFEISFGTVGDRILKPTAAYFVDSNTKEVTECVNSGSQLISFVGEVDGWLVIPFTALTDAQKSWIKTDGDRISFLFHTSSCKHGTYASDNTSDWSNRVVWFGDMALLNNEANFLKTYASDDGFKNILTVPNGGGTNSDGFICYNNAGYNKFEGEGYFWGLTRYSTTEVETAPFYSQFSERVNGENMFKVAVTSEGKYRATWLPATYSLNYKYVDGNGAKTIGELYSDAADYNCIAVRHKIVGNTETPTTFNVGNSNAIDGQCNWQNVILINYTDNSTTTIKTSGTTYNLPANFDGWIIIPESQFHSSAPVMENVKTVGFGYLSNTNGKTFYTGDMKIVKNVEAFKAAYGAPDPADENVVMFSADSTAPHGDRDGMLFYTSYDTYGINGLGYADGGLLRNYQDNGFTSGDGAGYLYAHEIDGEKMWQFMFNVDENGNHAKIKGAYTSIYPFYSEVNGVAAGNVETLGDNYSNASEFTHLAIRIKLVDDGTGRYKKGSTHPISICPQDATAGSGDYYYWKNTGIYLQDKNTGEKIPVTQNALPIELGFDGYVVIPKDTVVSSSGVDKTLADLVRINIYTHWNCDHTGSNKATDSFVGTEFYVGDMILTKDINSFNAAYITLDPAAENTVMFSADPASPKGDPDGKLSYYYSTTYGTSLYGINGLGYSGTGFLRNYMDNGFTTGDGEGHLYAHEIDGEKMWQFMFNVDENGNHVKETGGFTSIYPFYSEVNGVAAEDIVTLGDNYANASEFTHLAIRIKLVKDKTNNYKEGSTHPISICPQDATAGTDEYHYWNSGNKGIYLQDKKTGEKIPVTQNAMPIELGFDGYVVIPKDAVVSSTGANKTLADLVKINIWLHWNCGHTGSNKATDSFVGTEFYVGDMILTKDIDSFNAAYITPDPAADNTVMFSADKTATNGDADGMLFYNGSYTYGENGLGYTQKGILRNYNNTDYNDGDGNAYLFADENEKKWKFTFNADANGNHVTPTGGGTYIYPFYSDTYNPNTEAGKIANEDVETLGDNSELYGDISEYTHLAIRVKFINDGTGRYKEGSTQPLSINLNTATGTDNNFGVWNKHGGVYFQDINTGERIKVDADSMQLPLGFDGYLIFPQGSVAGVNDTLNPLSELVKIHILLHWNCTHYGAQATDSWVGTELYIGDMILTKNINSFNRIHFTPLFSVTSDDSSITIESDDVYALYSFNKDAAPSKWMTKQQFNAAAQNLPKGTSYTVYAKYATSTLITSKKIRTTSGGVAGFLLDVPQEDTYLSYSDKYISWGSQYIVKTPGADPFSNTGYSTGSSQGLFVRQPEDASEHFIVFNLQETSNTAGLQPEGNVGLYWNTISGLGMNVAADGTKTHKTGMPEDIDRDSIEAIAIRFKISGGTADQYSSMSFYLNGAGDYLQLSRGYLIDNTTGLVMNPYFNSNEKGHWLNLKGEFDGWLVLPYEYFFTGHRKFLETTGTNIQPFFHTNACADSNHGKDTASSWTDKIFWLGDIAIVADEEKFINANTRPVNSEGMVFSSNDYYTVDGVFTQMTNTFEAWVKFPENYPKNIRGGQMLSNEGKSNNTITYEILANGNPSVSAEYYEYDRLKSTSTKTFDQVNLYNGKWTHLAIVNDQANDKVICYVDGVAKQTITGALDDSIHVVSKDLAEPIKSAAVLGGSFMSGNVLAFRGEMKEVALYSDARTAGEIGTDKNSVGSDNLMAHWDLTKEAVDGKLTDKSGNNHNVTVGKVWFDGSVDPDDYDYSFAIVGDTQYVNYNWDDRYSDIYDWIVENKDTQKIEYVMGMGDITENDADAQWQRAATEHAKLDAAKIPYSLIKGNHDSSAKFNATFNKAPYNTSYTGSFDGKIDNSYREITVRNVKYLIFTLSIGASDEVLEWAGKIVEAHPNHNVIFTTHAYLYRNGLTMDENFQYSSVNPSSGYESGGNDAEEMWNELFGKYKNVRMVICGHVAAETAEITERIGVNGNTVKQVLVDMSGVDKEIGAAGIVTMLHFSNDGKTVSVENYSTVRDKHYKTQGQYELEMDLIKHPVIFHSASLTLDNSTAVNFKVDTSYFYNFTNVYATFKLDGIDGTVRVDAPVDSNGNFKVDDKGMLVFTFDNIPAEMMGNTITATIHATIDGVECSDTVEYSVKTYCYNKLKKYEAYVEGSGYPANDIRYAVAFKKLIVDLLNYGSSVQLYTNTNIDDLVNGNLKDAEKALASTHIPEMNGLRKLCNNLDDATIKWVSGNLSYQHNVQLIFKFEFAEGKQGNIEDYKLVITSDDEGKDPIATIDSNSDNFLVYSGGARVYFDGFYATQMDDNIYVAVCDENGNRVSDVLAYSISAYARQKYTPDDPNNKLSNVVLAMMRYGDAAENYDSWRGYVVSSNS